MSKTEDLFQEILGNIRKDRVSVEKMRDRLLYGIGADEGEGPQITVGEIAENVAKLSDVLTKMNSQLVELTKLSSKSDKSEDVMTSDDLYDAIESN